MFMLYRVFFTCLAILISVLLTNYVSLTSNVWQATKEDKRNDGISLFVHYDYLLNLNEIVVDIREVNTNKSSLDVMRILMQSAEALKSKKFDVVYLSHQGNKKFFLKGNYFEKLGDEYKYQNPVYTMRTLPENVYKLDGTKAFDTWQGGMLGVLGKQMEDLNSFTKQLLSEK